MSYSIMIVDDSATTRAMIKRIIGMAELPVSQLYEAPDGKAALERLAAAPVDLVLADLNMPEMSGVEMTHLMRQDQRMKQIPVVVVSAEPNIDRLTQLKADGVQGYVRKPFTPEVIRDVVTQLLGGVHA
jgi:two-component system chemotaxis response regulator CheY